MEAPDYFADPTNWELKESFRGNEDDVYIKLQYPVVAIEIESSINKHKNYINYGKY